MPIFAFTVPGDPVTWKRARRGKGHSYTDPKDAAHREKIRAYARNAGIRRPLEGAIALTIRFFRDSRGLPTALATGDLDNLVKLTKDALGKGLAFHDDRQVVRLYAEKACDAENPRTDITITGE